MYSALALLLLSFYLYRGWPPPDCVPVGTYRVTGYVRGHHSDLTADGTSVWTREKIVAASYDLPIDTRVKVRGLDYTYRVADRGLFSGPHVDVLVDTVAQAYAIETWVGGKYAEVCVVGPPL